MAERRTALTDTLRQRIVSGLHLEVLAAGDRLPSVRELARELSADPRVVLAAVRALEREGLVELRPRSGIYVIGTATALKSPSQREADWFVDLLVEGLAHDIAGPEFGSHIRRSLDTLQLKVACIECNHDQNAQLCSELRDDYGLEAHPVELFDLLAAVEPPDLVRQADLLVTSQYHASQIFPVASALAKPLIIAPLQVGLFAGIADILATGPAYFVVSDPRFAKKLGDIFRSSPGSENFHPLVLGTDDLAQIPAGAPVYVTDRASEMLPAQSRWRRELPHMRSFTPETARQLFSFIVRANLGAGPANPPISSDTR